MCKRSDEKTITANPGNAMNANKNDHNVIKSIPGFNGFLTCVYCY